MPDLVNVIRKYGVVWAPEGEDFTLASGAKSKFYVDFSKVVMTTDGIQAVALAIFKKLVGLDFDRVGGPMSGADPIVGALLSRFPYESPVRGFTVRKEPKGRGPGAGDMFEGYLHAGDRVVLVEDVTTSGGSVLKAARVVEERGARVVKIVTLLDRLAGARDKLAAYDFAVCCTLDDLGLEA